MEPTPRMEAERLLTEAMGFPPHDEATPGFIGMATAFALLAVADELEAIKNVLGAPIDTYNGTVRTVRIGS